MDDYYKNKTVCISGASRGIGYELAKKLIDFGATVHSMSRTKPPSDSDQHIHYQADLSKNTIPESLLGIPFDIIILNVGSLPKRASFEELTLDEIEDAIQLNVISHIRLLKRLKYKKVAIVNSVAADFGVPEFSIYCASKAFMQCLNEALLLEGKDSYIIKPYKVDTTLAPDFCDFYQLKKEYVAQTILEDLYKGRKKRTLSFIFAVFPILKALLPDCVVRFGVKLGCKWMLKKKVE